MQELDEYVDDVGYCTNHLLNSAVLEAFVLSATRASSAPSSDSHSSSESHSLCSSKSSKSVSNSSLRYFLQYMSSSAPTYGTSSVIFPATPKLQNLHLK